jgi:hypothetical protein
MRESRAERKVARLGDGGFPVRGTITTTFGLDDAAQIEIPDD